MMKTLFSVAMLYAFCSFSQNSVSGTLSDASGLPNVERNFTGFNSGQGYMENIYNIYNSDAGLEVNADFNEVFDLLGNNISWRFPGGTTSNYYNRWASGYGNAGMARSFGDAWSRTNIKADKLESNYGDYAGFYNTTYPNAKSNIIFPFINSITQNRSVSASSVFCLNLINHYRSIPFIGHVTRKELFLDSAKIKTITNLDGNYLEAFHQSSLSDEFRQIVLQNMDAFLTLVQNGVNIYQIELGNELYAHAYYDNIFTDYHSFVNNTNFFFQSDTKVWIRDDNSARSISDSYSTLWTYAHLSRLYRVLITDTLQKLAAADGYSDQSVFTAHLRNLKFGIPISDDLDGGFKRWNYFMIQPEIREYIGATAYIVHPYFDQTNYLKGVRITDAANSSTSDLTREFNIIRDSMETAYNKRYFREKQVHLINALPDASELWYTEWNLNFDNNNLKKVGNTLLHAMFYQDAMMNFFDINANRNLKVACTKRNPVQLANYILPYATNPAETWYNLTNFKDGYFSQFADPYTATEPDNSITYNAAFYAALLLAPVLKDTALLYVDAENGGFEEQPNLSFRSFQKEDCSTACCTKETYVYFNNKSETDYTIDLMSALGLDENSCVRMNSSYLYASNLYASLGTTTFRPDQTEYTDTASGAAAISIQKTLNREISDSSYSSISIPKYAFGYIKVIATALNKECSCDANLRKAPAIPLRKSSIKESADASALHVSIYPNPVTAGNLYIDINAPSAVNTDIQLFDITGNLIKAQKAELNEGQNTVQLDLSDLAKAAYFIHISNTAFRYNSKVILQ